MTSAIDPTLPTEGNAFTSDVRANFQAAHDEIEALQAGGGGIPEAPPDGQVYGRNGTDIMWEPVLLTSGGEIDGTLTVKGDADFGTQGAPLIVKASNLQAIMEFDNPYGFMQVGLQYGNFVFGFNAQLGAPIFSVDIAGNSASFGVQNLIAQGQITAQSALQVNGPANFNNYVGGVGLQTSSQTTADFQGQVTLNDTTVLGNGPIYDIATQQFGGTPHNMALGWDGFAAHICIDGTAWFALTTSREIADLKAQVVALQARLDAMA